MSHKFKFVTEPTSPGAYARMSQEERDNILHQRKLDLGLEMVLEALVELGMLSTAKELQELEILPQNERVDKLLDALWKADNEFCPCEPIPIDPEADNRQIRYVSSYQEMKRFHCPKSGTRRSLWRCVRCGDENLSSQIPDSHMSAQLEGRANKPGLGVGSDAEVLRREDK